MGLVVISYISALLIEKTKYKKSFLILGVSTNILNLMIFKYLNFIVENLEIIINFGLNYPFSFDFPSIALPIGISFFTFQSMSYLIDVYRREVRAQENLFWLMLYIMMFPQLIAGPIVRYRDVNNEIAKRVSSLDMVETGIKRFIVGFAKKVFIANSMGNVADTIFSLNGTTNTAYAWLGAISYALQIYFDFSAYSDMAIGLGLIFGFHFNENFNYPYISKSIQEFWRRWHISLSSWFKDYVYIPLGGNRKGIFRTYINLFIVFLLTGIWHGAAWQFIIWGLVHGCFMLIERAGFSNTLKKLPGSLSRIYTLFVVVVSWVFFRADSLSHAILYLQNMFSFNFDGLAFANVVNLFTNLFWIVSVISLAASTPLFREIGQTRLGSIAWLNRICYLLLFIVSIIYLSGISYNPFIYFKF